MPHLNEYQKATLLTLTSQTEGALPELESRWLKAVTGLNAHVNEMWPVFLTNKGFTTGGLNERQLAYWYSIGAPAKSTWNEAYRWFWDSEGGGGGASGGVFKMTVRMTGASQTLELAVGTGTTHNCSINWGDGSANSSIVPGTAASAQGDSHVYAAAGDYQVTITGICPVMGVAGIYSTYLRSIDQWGKMGWTALNGAFDSCPNLISVAKPGASDFLLVQNASSLFLNDTALTSLDFSGVRLPAVNNMSSFVSGCSELTTVNFTGVEWPAVAHSMSGLFYNCPKLASVLGSANMVNAFCTNLSQFASVCPLLTTLDMSGWNTAGVQFMNSTFNGSTLLNPDIRNLNIAAVTSMTTLMTGCAFAQNNYDPMLINWAAQTRQAAVTVSFGAAKYGAGSAAARATIIATPWTLSDGGAA